jgi:hypothetical protein
MPNQKSNRDLSLGKLRPKDKTKPKSPDATSRLYIKRELLLELYKQIDQSNAGEVGADMAGWFNEDDIGKYMTIQLSTRRAAPRDCGEFFDFR